MMSLEALVRHEILKISVGEADESRISQHVYSGALFKSSTKHSVRNIRVPIWTKGVAIQPHLHSGSVRKTLLERSDFQ